MRSFEPESADFIIHQVAINEGTENHLNIVVSWKDDPDTVFGFSDVHFAAEGNDAIIRYTPIAHTRKDDISDEELLRDGERLLNAVILNAFPDMPQPEMDGGKYEPDTFTGN